MGVAVGDYNNDGFPDILITCVGQNRLFRILGKEHSSMSPAPVASASAKDSALRRCGSTMIAMGCSIFLFATM